MRIATCGIREAPQVSEVMDGLGGISSLVSSGLGPDISAELRLPS